VQRFSYRRGLRNSLPGNIMVLHPDEAHDGQAGTEEAFRYRMVYVQPALFQQVLSGRALPFLEGGVTTDPRVAAATSALLQGDDVFLEPLEQSDALSELANALASVCASHAARQAKGDFRAAWRARDYLDANLVSGVTLAELEAATGRDRWSLSNDFRTFYGTSPYRYLTMRRLDIVRCLLLRGSSLARAAAFAGFADQSHMTRHLVKTFGMTPGRWMYVVGGRVGKQPGNLLDSIGLR